MALNDEAWEKIFTSLPLLDDIDRTGFVYVTADDIKRASGGREPRLLAKIDRKNLRPEIFKRHKLSILPVENGKYIIFRDELSKTYFSLEPIFSAINPEEYHPGRDFCNYQSLGIQSISSESQAIDYANLVSLLKTFTDERELNLTIRGRQRSGSFSMKLPVDHHTVQVSGVQIEVDAGYESPERIYLFEAKIGRVEDFNIRQLYYPYENWTQKTLKEVIPLFFIYTNGLFYIIQFAFGTEYGELHFVRGKCFTINEPVKQQINLQNLIQSIEMESEPAVPYPQANDLDKVIDLVTNYPNGLTNKTAIAEFFEFDERQGDYYANAAIYLGLLKRGRSRSSEFELTREGEYMASNSQNRSQRNLLLLKQMLKKPSFREIIIQWMIVNWNLSSLDTEMIAPIIQRHIVLNETTARRRASTVISWLKWIKDAMEIII
jgi:hypothetical protein